MKTLYQRLLLAVMLTLTTHAYAISATDIIKQQTKHEAPTGNHDDQAPFNPIINRSPIRRPTENLPHSTYALVYIFSSKCPYCQKFTPILAEFLAQHPHLQRYGFSLDGQGIQGFEHPMFASKDVIHHFFNTPHFVYPATFFVNTETNKFTGLTYQNVPLTTLESRYETLVTSPQMLNALN